LIRYGALPGTLVAKAISRGAIIIGSIFNVLELRACSQSPRLVLHLQRVNVSDAIRLKGTSHMQKTEAARTDLTDNGRQQFASNRISKKDIALVAYRLWEERGRPEGSPNKDWYRAEQELAARADPPQSTQ